MIHLAASHFALIKDLLKDRSFLIHIQKTGEKGMEKEVSVRKAGLLVRKKGKGRKMDFGSRFC